MGKYMMRRQPTPTSLAIMQARAKHKYITQQGVANLSVAIEYEDENYTYISSRYQHKKLKADIESIKRPITIIWH
jgi:hypothetical protein